MRITSSGFLQLAGNNGVVTGDNEHIFRQGQTSYNVLQLRAESNSYVASGGGAFSIGVTRSASSSYSFADGIRAMGQHHSQIVNTTLEVMDTRSPMVVHLVMVLTTLNTLNGPMAIQPTKIVVDYVLS